MQVATPKLHHHSGARLEEEKTEIADDKSQKMIDDIFRLVEDIDWAFLAILCIPTNNRNYLRLKVPCQLTIPAIFEFVEIMTGTPRSSFGLKHKDRRIFSSDGKNRSLVEYGICENDDIIVDIIMLSQPINLSSPNQDTSISISHSDAKAEPVRERPSERQSPSLDQETSTSFTRSNIKTNPAHQRSPQRRRPWGGVFVEKPLEDYLDHEAELQTNRMKRKDDAMQHTEPKRQPEQIKPTPQGSYESTVPGSGGLGDEAVNGSVIVNVGEIQNLYKTSKRSKLHNSRPRDEVDLHGLNPEDARKKLDDSLPIWIDAAMKGEYPYVIRVMIIHGKGKQILSDMVEQWIKDHRQVVKAPKP